MYDVVAKRCRVFKSAIKPMRMVFEARIFPENWKDDGSMPLPEMIQYPVMVKNGDDMRQDQLILQMIKLMDTLLKDINLDFRFTCYSALACSKRDGIMDFVEDSTTIQDVIG